LIRASKGAHTALLNLEELEDKEIDRLRDYYEKLAERARANLRAGIRDTGAPEEKSEEEDRRR
jgi:low affinity Fe/Cu permease